MAVEIRELVIKAIVTKEETGEPDIGMQAAASTGSQQMIQECVNQVLKIIRQSQNR